METMLALHIAATDTIVAAEISNAVPATASLPYFFPSAKTIFLPAFL